MRTSKNIRNDSVANQINPHWTIVSLPERHCITPAATGCYALLLVGQEGVKSKGSFLNALGIECVT
jgi:hypothetical protein